MTTEREELIAKLRAGAPLLCLTKRELALVIGALQFADFAHRQYEAANPQPIAPQKQP